jgi:hypothetical protein
MNIRKRLETPYRSVGDVVAGLSALEAFFLERRDKRGVFVAAYLPITLEIQRRIQEGRFDDNAWVAAYLVAFANLYRQALAAYDSGRLASVPKPWRIAFDAAADDSCLLLQHLLLGINAHINHDLPIALSEVTIDPDRASRQRDHTAVNEALQVATDPVQERLARLYAPGLGLLDVVAGVFDEQLTNFSFEKAREAAWTAGVLLVDAGDDVKRAAVRKRTEEQAAALARLVLAPHPAAPTLFAVLRQLEWPPFGSEDPADRGRFTLDWGLLRWSLRATVEADHVRAEHLGLALAGLPLPSLLATRLRFDLSRQGTDLIIEPTLAMPFGYRLSVARAIVNGFPIESLIPPPPELEPPQPRKRSRAQKSRSR